MMLAIRLCCATVPPLNIERIEKFFFYKINLDLVSLFSTSGGWACDRALGFMV